MEVNGQLHAQAALSRDRHPPPPPYPSVCGCVSPRASSDVSEKIKVSCRWREFKRPARSLVTTITELSQLPKITYSLNTYGPFLGGKCRPCWPLQCSTQTTRLYWVFFPGGKWRPWWLLQWSTRPRVFWHITRNQLFIWRRGMWGYRFGFYRAQMSHRRR